MKNCYHCIHRRLAWYNPPCVVCGMIGCFEEDPENPIPQYEPSEHKPPIRVGGKIRKFTVDGVDLLTPPIPFKSLPKAPIPEKP